MNPKHEDFPALLAEALDVIVTAKFELSLAALRLNVSGSQLVKLLKRQPEALSLVNRERWLRGLSWYR